MFGNGENTVFRFQCCQTGLTRMEKATQLVLLAPRGVETQ